MKADELKETNKYKVQLSYAYLYEQIETLDATVEKVARAVCSPSDFTDARARNLIRLIEMAKLNAFNLKNEIESLLEASGGCVV